MHHHSVFPPKLWGTLFLKHHLLVGADFLIVGGRGGVTWGRARNSIATIFPKFLWFSYIKPVSCLKWFLRLIDNLINCFYSIAICRESLDHSVVVWNRFLVDYFWNSTVSLRQNHFKVIMFWYTIWFERLFFQIIFFFQKIDENVNLRNSSFL